MTATCTPDGCFGSIMNLCSAQKPLILADGTPAIKKGDLYLVLNTQDNRVKIAQQYDGDESLIESMLFMPELINVPLVDIERIFGGVV